MSHAILKQNSAVLLKLRSMNLFCLAQLSFLVSKTSNRRSLMLVQPYPAQMLIICFWKPTTRGKPFVQLYPKSRTIEPYSAHYCTVSGIIWLRKRKSLSLLSLSESFPLY